MSNRRNTSKQLRDAWIFSGSDSFMRGGHQIINSNRVFANHPRKNSDWSKSDNNIRILLFNIFPKMLTDSKQRERAGKWLRVIQLFYRTGFSSGDIAEELKVTRNSIKCILKQIRRAIKGAPLDGRKKYRKKKVSVILGDQ